jgi:hypothetical protein
MIALLPLLLAAAPVADADARRPASRVAVATVTIIRAERVEVKPPPARGKPQDRQYRRRDAVPMVEFF